MPDRSEQIAFHRLSDIAPEEITAHMSDPRLRDHMPLLDGVRWDAATTEKFVAGKERCWAQDGLGHWAFVVGGRYVGWGGFEKEGDDWDFGLVLRPDAFGLGRRIADKALRFARKDPRIPYVTFLLPPSRRHLGALRRLGAEEIGMVPYQGAEFRKFRLLTGADA
ncbi:GNAT family N-acetyltransferase [Epibacterium sp. MM17-32]|uniref:GNAT family N-acetyltransferase n=1 Tax=Epibacterium sp. MM17-32 TaxID=2917734 RepID=UPI001EF68A44|nr:GNAT family N-acetyltransferase [Epibacterium sp. MM17-32]MCG7630413.1 GNAT family N-acetyltransferase [Epibacterium sp. MM17-32]